MADYNENWHIERLDDGLDDHQVAARAYFAAKTGLDVQVVRFYSQSYSEVTPDEFLSSIVLLDGDGGELQRVDAPRHELTRFLRWAEKHWPKAKP